MAATLLVARPAEADGGDSYTWVASGPGNFSDPANWVRSSDGQHGVPGPDDSATIIDPPGTVTVDAPATVDVLLVQAAVDGTLDFEIDGNGETPRLHARSATIDGDSFLGGGLDTNLLTLGGATASGGTHNVFLSTRNGQAGELLLDDLTLQPNTGLFNVDGDATIRVGVQGGGPSTLNLVTAGDSDIDLQNEDGATFAGKLFLAGDVTLHGDVSADTTVYVSGETTWLGDGDGAALDAGMFLVLDHQATLHMPDDVSVTGILDMRGTADGGDLHVAAGGALAFPTFDRPTGSPARITLTGSFDAQPGVGIWDQDGATDACVGDEDVLVRAPGGVTAFGVDLFNEPSQLDADLVRMRTQLAAVVRGTDSTGCAIGASERLVRSLYRDLLGRVADGGGASYWAGVLDGGGTPTTSVAVRLLSTLAAQQNLVRQTWSVWSCDGVAPTDDQVADGVGFLASGGTLADLRARVLTSTVPEDGDPVACLYRAVLGRAPDAGGRTYAESRLERESLSRLARRYMVTSEGRRVQFNRLYQRLLGRDASAEEVRAGTTEVRHGRPETWVTALIAGSEEYAARASE
jgi:PAS domain-containing protein